MLWIVFPPPLATQPFSHTAILAYGLVYPASHGRICLREGQLATAVHDHEGRDTIHHPAGTGSGKTMQNEKSSRDGVDIMRRNGCPGT
ncbi:hypothetical protein BV25DRAFT_1922889 [Artomyces pyxidatus]|uniref:Uncharacterized protein n=1 Tax=Artomyces pyxidatus TaxID=48021 RepID=A0ACB8SD38_9AGAM|nr:hypothetical protein BV25DRAFT_1922889 [Artomyces pyxidatus]